jgi:hypothetical protein
MEKLEEASKAPPTSFASCPFSLNEIKLTSLPVEEFDTYENMIKYRQALEMVRLNNNINIGRLTEEAAKAEVLLSTTTVKLNLRKISSPLEEESNANSPKRQREDDVGEGDAERVKGGGDNSNEMDETKDGTNQEKDNLNATPFYAQNLIKPSQQIPIVNFWNYVDSFFRPLNEEDLKLLESTKIDEAAPFIVPPLGKHYLDQWADEERKGGGGGGGGIHVDNLISSNGIIPEDAYCGEFTERILSCLLPDENFLVVREDETLEEQTFDVLKNNSNFNILERIKEEMYDFEDRVKKELEFTGLMDKNVENIDDGDVDEIYLEMRKLQSDLRHIVDINNKRKGMLMDLALEKMAYQDFNLVLDDINKQLESRYQKTFVIHFLILREIKRRKRNQQAGTKWNPLPLKIRLIIY